MAQFIAQVMISAEDSDPQQMALVSYLLYLSNTVDWIRFEVK